MKKIKLNTAKLQFNKEQITALTNREMQTIEGGEETLGNCVPISATCPTKYVCPTDPYLCPTTNCCDKITNI